MKSHPRMMLATVLVAITLGLTTKSAGDSPPDQYRLFNAYDSLIVDSYTKLVWRRRTSSEAMTQEEAVAYCETLSTPDERFRLPTVRELATLVDEVGQAELGSTGTVVKRIDVAAFPDTPVSWPHWTSNENLYSSQHLPYGIDFNTGQVLPYGRSDRGYARCVRNR